MREAKKGFTLIELIVVVAIIGILASIATPKFGDIQRDAKIGADIATAKNIASVINFKIVKENYTESAVKQIDNTNYSGLGLQSIPKSNLNSLGSYWYKILDGTPIVYIAISDKGCTYANQVYPEPKTATSGDTERNEYYDKDVIKQEIK